MLSGVIGLAIGLAIAALAYPSLSNLPDPYGSVLPVTASIFFGYVGAAVMVMRQQDIFNILGRRVTTLVDDNLDIGSHHAHWDGRDSNGDPVAAGVYFARLAAGDFSSSIKLVLVK